MSKEKYVYKKQTDIIKRKKKLGLTNRDIGNAIGIPPGTISGKLAGFSPLRFRERQAINRFFEMYERGLVG
jgi:hypothetical protein